MSTGTTSAISIEQATYDDIHAAAHVYQAAAHDLSDRLRAVNPWANLAARSEDFDLAVQALHRLRERDNQLVLVARGDTGVTGMAALAIDPPHAHIAFLFVLPKSQNKGVGRILLEALREQIDARGASVITLASSRDPKAWQRYMRFGLRPGPPLLPFRASTPVFPVTVTDHPRYQVRSVQEGDLELIARIDRPVRGADRRDRISGWLDDGATGSIVFERSTGEPVAYGLVSLDQHCGQVGPVAALHVDAFPMALQAALVEAGAKVNSRQLPWKVDFSARNHDAIPILLDAGFSLDTIVNWFESGPVGQWDRYIFRNEDEL
jgi:GNAT superfamily N-acetyltransferase